MSRSTMRTLDDALLVIVVAVGVLIALQVIGWIVGTIVFLVKVALVALAVGIAVRIASGSRRSARLGRGYRGELD